jgi:hypothetical protein
MICWKGWRGIVGRGGEGLKKSGKRLKDALLEERVNQKELPQFILYWLTIGRLIELIDNIGDHLEYLWSSESTFALIFMKGHVYYSLRGPLVFPLSDIF